MLGTVLDSLPPRARPYVVGALAAGLLVLGAYAVATYAVEQRVRPLEAKIAHHEEQDRLYLYPLLEAIWSDSRSLCAANPQAKCDGYDPVKPMSHGK